MSNVFLIASKKAGEMANIAKCSNLGLNVGVSKL